MRFGISVALDARLGGCDRPLTEYRLLDTAESMLGPERFAEMMFDAVKHFDFTPGQPPGKYLSRLASELDLSRPYQAAVSTAVARKIASASIN